MAQGWVQGQVGFDYARYRAGCVGMVQGTAMVFSWEGVRWLGQGGKP